MAVRTGYVGTQVAGDVLTAANFSKLPGGWIGDAQVTATQSGITTEVDLTGLSVAVTVGASRKIKITATVGFNSSVSQDIAIMNIKEGGTVLQWATILCPAGAATVMIERSITLTPSAGAHTYKLSAARSAGTGSVAMGAAATAPAMILVEDIGPAA